MVMACDRSTVVYIQLQEVRNTLTNMREYLAIGIAITTIVSTLGRALLRIVRLNKSDYVQRTASVV
jgi:hypothetical protein